MTLALGLGMPSTRSRARSSLGPPDPFWPNVELLLHMEETGLPYDSSNNHYTMIQSGGAVTSPTRAFAGARSLTTSVTLGDILRTSNVINIGTNLSWTFDFRVWCNSAANSPHIFQLYFSAGNRVSVHLDLGKLQYSNIFAGSLKDTADFPLNQWVSVSINILHTTGGNYDVAMYVNGARVGILSGGVFSINTGTSCVASIGAPFGFTGANFVWDGYIDEVRITKGVARYGGSPATITPGTGAYPDYGP